MKHKYYLLISLTICIKMNAQWSYPNSNEISTADEVIAPVLRIENEIRVANTFSPVDPSIGTLDNSGYGINIHKTNGIGLAFNGVHRVLFETDGDIVTTASDPSIKIKGTGTGNYQGATLRLSAEGVTPGNSHASTWFMTHRGTDGTATIEMQRRGMSDEYYGTPLMYKDGYGWRFKVASSTTSTSTSNGLMIKQTGYVGIGTNSPSAKLHISSETSGDAILKLESDTDNNQESDNPLIQLRQDGGQVGVNIGYSEENFGGNIFGIGTRYSNQETWDVFTINTSNGNVGIGTKNASTWKLAVKGKIRAEEIKVETGWADYVFKEDYNLPTLEEVEKHIQENGHLINIPSAKEVEENGIQLGEMNKLLLEKIEEQMLYILQQQKQIKQQKENLQQLTKQVEVLQNLINELKN